MVQATALEMTDVGATIAMGGRRPIPTLLADQRPRFVHVTSRHVARLVQRMMVAVVQFGTGTAAADPGRQGRRQDRHRRAAQHDRPDNPNASSAQNTDAWFVGYAPVGRRGSSSGRCSPSRGRRRDRGAGRADVLVAALQAH